MYWRRRILLLGVLLVIVGLVAYGCSGSDSTKPVGKASASATPTPPTSSSGIIAPSATATGSAPPQQSYPTGPPASGSPGAPGMTNVAATGPGSSGGTGGVGGSGGSSGGGTGAGSGGAATATSGGSGCLLQVGVRLDKTSSNGPVVYAAGQYPTFSVSVQDVGSANCQIDASGKGVVITVTSVGSQSPAWSSAVCSAAADLRELGPGDGFNESIAWPRYQSDASCPTTNRPTVAPGTYAVSAAADGVSAASVQFVLD
jgi:hypothetical protein